MRGSPDEPNVIRECYIENRVQVYDSHSPDGSVAILRNFFTGELALEIGCIFKLCIVRNNIFSGTLKGSCGNHVVHADWFEFTNNTLLSIPNALSIETVAARRLHESRIQEHRREQAFQPKFDQGHAPTGQGAIYNNLHHRPGLVFVWDDGAKDLWSWQIGYNCYPGSGDFPIENTMPRPTNTLAMPVFYSLLPQEPNYARLKPDSPGATTGAGGDWPSYTGALPPGPAPKNGDWFTRLMERWGGVQPTKTGEPQEEIAGSVQIEEPPPLEEWLKGRKILTVAQDGSGQFKTIQAALDALQVGEVVQVLDRGPYREQLNSHRFPSDSGLISKVRTIIELPQATILDDGRSAGHRFVIPDRFRLHGLAFQFPAIEKGLGLVCGGDDGLVIEQCQFRITNNPFDGSSTVYLHSGPKGLSNPTVVRDCRFDGRLMVNGDPNPFDRDVLILRNYFTAYDGEKTPLGVIHAFRTLVIRENVIKGGAVSFSTLEGSQSIDVSRNTFVGDMTLNVFGSLPEHVSFDRNLFSDYGQIAVTKTLPTHRINRWQMTLNYSQGRTVDWEGTIRAPQGPTDRVMPFRFLSKLPDNRDYLRLPIPREGDENSVPDGIGALPAGPRPPEGDWFSRLQESWFEIQDEPSPR